MENNITLKPVVGGDDEILHFYILLNHVSNPSESDKEVIFLISNLYCLKQNQNGTPHHPLYLSKETKPSPYTQ